MLQAAGRCWALLGAVVLVEACDMTAAKLPLHQPTKGPVPSSCRLDLIHNESPGTNLVIRPF